MHDQHSQHRGTDVPADRPATPHHTGELAAVHAVPNQRGERRCGWSTQESLAVAAIRRYLWERKRTQKQHREPNPARGRPGRTSGNRCDASIVRCIDFERCLEQIDSQTRVILIRVLGCGDDMSTVAEMCGISTRTVLSHIQPGLARLTALLDERELL